FHLAFDHDGAGAVAHGLDDLLGVRDVFGSRGEDTLCNVDLDRMQAPCTHTAQQERVAELIFAGHCVADIAERAPERQDVVGGAGVDHACHRVMPEILRVALASYLDVVSGRVGAHDIAGMTCAYP